jgi:hypothetical protein
MMHITSAPISHHNMTVQDLRRLAELVCIAQRWSADAIERFVLWRGQNDARSV